MPTTSNFLRPSQAKEQQEVLSVSSLFTAHDFELILLRKERPRYATLATSARSSSRERLEVSPDTAPIHAMFASGQQNHSEGGPIVHAISSDYRPDSEYDNGARESRYDDGFSEGFNSNRASLVDQHAAIPMTTSLTLPDDDRISNESGSGGSSTKIGSGSPSDSRTPSAYNSERRYDEAGAHWTRDAIGPPSDSSHDMNPNIGPYSNNSYNASGYVDQPLYGPSSPSSGQSHSSMAPYNHRYRQSSYPDSNRASSIGADHMGNGIPYNSSRTALNQDWRSSSDLDAIAVAPGKEMYGSPKDVPFSPTANFNEKDGSTYVPIPPSSPALGSPINEKQGGLTGPDGQRQPEPAVVLARANRLA